MTEERITETRTPDGNTHTTTYVRETGEKSGGGKWVLLVVIIALAIGALLVFSQMSGAEIAKDNAMADAAEDVGNAANQVGDAAQEAGEAVQDAADNLSE